MDPTELLVLDHSGQNTEVAMEANLGVGQGQRGRGNSRTWDTAETPRRFHTVQNRESARAQDRRMDIALVNKVLLERRPPIHLEVISGSFHTKTEE